MTRPPSGAVRAADDRDQGGISVADLVSKVSQDMSILVRQELELAKAEIRQEARKSGKGAGLLGAAGLAAVMVLLFLSLALWAAFAIVMHPGLAAVAVAAIWATAAAVLYGVGHSQLRHVNPTPQRTTETLKQAPDSLRGSRADNREETTHD
jgi:hypothetical protein